MLFLLLNANFVSGDDVCELMEFFRKTWPSETIPPKLHMLETHAADFMGSWKTGHGIHGEHGAKSIHKVFNTLTLLSLGFFGPL